jgi:hypothetical protein
VQRFSHDLAGLVLPGNAASSAPTSMQHSNNDAGMSPKNSELE